MKFEELKQRALEIRAKYSELEKQKHGKEWSKEELMLGFVGDVGDLSKLVIAKEGMREIENTDQKLAHELSDCLWCIFVLADKYGIDLETSFLKTMDELQERIARGDG